MLASNCISLFFFSNPSILTHSSWLTADVPCTELHDRLWRAVFDSNTAHWIHLNQTSHLLNFSSPFTFF
jgi:hypothetical protein